MRIGILGYVGPHRTGVGRYLDEVVSRWAERCREERHAVQIYVNRDSPLQIASESWIRRAYIPAPADAAIANLLWVLTAAPRAYQAANFDVIWLPNVTWAPPATTPLVATIHDITEFRIPDKVDPLRVLYRRFAMPRLAARSKGILCVSENTKQDIIEEFGIPAAKISVVPNGVSERFRPEQREHPADLAARWGLRQPYVLYVGTLDHPSKNAATLVRAFAAARPALPEGTQLVLAGKAGRGYDALRAIATNLGLGPTSAHARWLGYVPERELPGLYASAGAFVFPSLYEGFGLPVLEAMASGVPTITSDVGALREVALNAALLVPPLDVRSIAQALVALFANPSLARDHARRGLERAKAFSWERSASATLDALISSARRRAISSEAPLSLQDSP